MAIEFRLTIDDARLTKALSDPVLIQGPVHRFLEKAGKTVEERAKQNSPVDTGRLRSSIASRAETTRAIIGSNVVYAPFVELGTRPHMPPVSALQPWARRHGFASPWLLAMAIARRGTRAHPYLRPALEDSKRDIEGFLASAAREIERKWSGG